MKKWNFLQRWQRFGSGRVWMSRQRAGLRPRRRTSGRGMLGLELFERRLALDATAWGAGGLLDVVQSDAIGDLQVIRIDPLIVSGTLSQPFNATSFGAVSEIRAVEGGISLETTIRFESFSDEYRQAHGVTIDNPILPPSAVAAAIPIPGGIGGGLTKPVLDPAPGQSGDAPGPYSGFDYPAGAGEVPDVAQQGNLLFTAVEDEQTGGSGVVFGRDRRGDFGPSELSSVVSDTVAGFAKLGAADRSMEDDARRLSQSEDDTGSVITELDEDAERSVVYGRFGRRRTPTLDAFVAMRGPRSFVKNALELSVSSLSFQSFVTQVPALSIDGGGGAVELVGLLADAHAAAARFGAPVASLSKGSYPGFHAAGSMGPPPLMVGKASAWDGPVIQGAGSTSDVLAMTAEMRGASASTLVAEAMQSKSDAMGRDEQRKSRLPFAVQLAFMAALAGGGVRAKRDLPPIDASAPLAGRHSRRQRPVEAGP